MVSCAQISKCCNVISFVDNKHRERAYNIKACYNQNKRKEDIGHKLFNLHNFEGIGLLLITVFYRKTRACNLLHFTFGCIEIGIGFQS